MDFNVLYLLVPAFYPLIVWLYRDVRVRALGGPSASRSPALTSSEVALIVACASVGAAIIHVSVIASHARDGLITQLFFTALTVVQSLWAFQALRRPSRIVWIAGIAINVVTLLIWMQTRRSGFERVGVSDSLCSVLEVVVVFGSTYLLNHPLRRIDRLVQGRLVAPLTCIALCIIGFVGFAMGGHH